MRFLIDQCLSPLLAKVLRDEGHDVVHVRERSMERASDSEILALAETEDRVLLSADADFAGILTVEAKRKPSLILFRGEFEPAVQEQRQLIVSCLPEISQHLDKGAIVVITRTKLRIREL